MKLIRENIESVKYLTEASESGKKNLYIEGTFLVGDAINKNNRMYEMRTLRNEVARYTKELIETNRALGELGHPEQGYNPLSSSPPNLKLLMTHQG